MKLLQPLDQSLAKTIKPVRLKTDRLQYNCEILLGTFYRTPSSTNVSCPLYFITSDILTPFCTGHSPFVVQISHKIRVKKTLWNSFFADMYGLKTEIKEFN